MKYFVIVFDTERAELLHFESYDDADTALRSRFHHESEHAAESAVEVAVLRAHSKEAIRQTHARYFAGRKKARPVEVA